MKWKRYLQIKCIRFPITFEGEFPKIKNDVTNLLTGVKKKYYINKLYSGSGSQKTFWNAINYVLGHDGINFSIDGFINNKLGCNDALTKANHSNKYRVIAWEP